VDVFDPYLAVSQLVDFLEDTAHHLSVLLLYAFRQFALIFLYAASGILR